MRISSVIRGIENVVIGSSIAATKKAKRAAHAAKIEVKAQQIALQNRAALKASAKLDKLSYAEREQLRRDQRAIQMRAEELMAD